MADTLLILSALLRRAPLAKWNLVAEDVKACPSLMVRRYLQSTNREEALNVASRGEVRNLHRDVQL